MDAEALRADGDADGDAPTPVGWTLWDAALVFVIWFAATILIRVMVGGELTDPFRGVLLLFGSSFVLGASTLLRIQATSQDEVRRLVGLERPDVRDVVAGLIYGVVGAVALTFGVGLVLRVLVDALDLQIPQVQQELRQLAAGSAAPLAILVIVVVAPIVEELFFRGMLFQAFERRLGVWPAAVLSAAVFGAVHGEWFVFVVTFLFGVYLAVIFRRRGTLITPIIAHMLFNGLGVLLIRAGVG